MTDYIIIGIIILIAIFAMPALDMICYKQSYLKSFKDLMKFKFEDNDDNNTK